MFHLTALYILAAQYLLIQEMSIFSYKPLISSGGQDSKTEDLRRIKAEKGRGKQQQKITITPV